MTMPSFAERTKISSILRGLMQGDGVHEEDKSVLMTSSLVTEKPPGGVPVFHPELEKQIKEMRDQVMNETLDERCERLAKETGQDVEVFRLFFRLTNKEALVAHTQRMADLYSHHRLFE